MSSTQIRAIVDKLLTNVSNQLVPQGYISEMILPELRVKQRSGQIGKYGNGHLRIVSSLVTGKSEYPMVDAVTRSSDNYKVESHALKSLVTSEDKDNVERPFDAEQDEVIALTTLLWLEKEKALADSLGDTAVLTNNVTLAGGDQWSAYTTSDPCQDLKDGRIAVRGNCGFAPNMASMDWDVAETLRFHPNLLDKLGYKDNRPGGLNDQELARAINVKRVNIAEVVYNTSKQGQADSIAPVWGKNLILHHTPERANLRQKSLGYRVQLISRKPRQVFKSFPDEPVGSTKVMVLDDYDQVLVDVGCAYLIKDCIA